MGEIAKPSFREGGKVVYPGVGVFSVVGVRHSDLLNGALSYVLSGKNATITVSVRSESFASLRKLSDIAEVRRAVEYVRTGKIAVVWDHNERMELNYGKFKNGSLMDLAEILAMLGEVRNFKILSMSESDLYRKAAVIFREEVEAVWGPEETRDRLNGFLKN